MGSSLCLTISQNLKEELPMNVSIPHHNLNAKEKKNIVSANQKLYKKAPKKIKSLMLNDLQCITGYSRKYIIYLLNLHNKTIMRRRNLVLKADITRTSTSKRGRRKIYTGDIAKILFKLWKISGGISSKHLKAFILENYDTLWSYPGLKDVAEGDRELIGQISAATIDRLLKSYRDRYSEGSIPFPIRKRRRKAAHLVKGQIGIEVWREKEFQRVGYVEVDLVEHNGGDSKGEFIYTLCGVDVKTYWVFLRPLRNKARVWVVEALDGIKKRSPFAFWHIHSDNGSEFINSHLLNYCREEGIEFTRSREHVSNDNPHVENRNMIVVRRYVGYARYDTEAELGILEEMYRYIELRHNYFIPTMRLKEKRKVGKRYRRVYDIKTPYQRVMEDPSISVVVKGRLKEIKEGLDIVEINRAIVRLYNQLERVHRRKGG